jgi:hypothetical protein
MIPGSGGAARSAPHGPDTAVAPARWSATIAARDIAIPTAESTAGPILPRSMYSVG